jgi:hypothetical protein
MIVAVAAIAAVVTIPAFAGDDMAGHEHVRKAIGREGEPECCPHRCGV